MDGREQESCAPSTSDEERLARIRSLNDALRTRGDGGQMFITARIIELGPVSVQAAMRMIREFADFTPDNDPYGEHDFGMVDLGRTRIMWKIDYYDADMRFGSEDPANPAVTMRVLTVLLASEY